MALSALDKCWQEEFGNAGIPESDQYEVVSSPRDSPDEWQEIQVNNKNCTVRIYNVLASRFLVPLAQDHSLCLATRYLAETYKNEEVGTPLKTAARKAIQLLNEQLADELAIGIDSF